MSATLVLVIGESVLLALLAVFVVALLRSHAEILRRLAAIEDRDPAGAATPAALATGAPAYDLVGQTLMGDAAKLALGPGSPSTLLAFLGSGCGSCAPLWASLRSGEARVPAGTRLVIVTKGAESESVTRLEALAPAGHEVLMSTAAWRDYSIPGSPHFVLAGGRSGRIAGRGSATSWKQMLTLVEQATSDVQRDAAGAPERHTTSARAARAEDALARAGITAGHPSLYPSDEHPAGAGRA